VKTLAITLFTISITGLIIQVLRGFSFTQLTETLGFYLKKNAFKDSIAKTMTDIDRLGAQNLAYIITTNCEDLKHLGGFFIGDIIENITTIMVGLAIAFAFSWQVTLVALAVLPVIVVAGKLQMSFSQGMQSNSDKVHKQTLEPIIESMMYIKTVKSLNLHHRIMEKYS
jgi:ATP-binding cassette subfamily B (MDR/TAP) protein 1